MIRRTFLQAIAVSVGTLAGWLKGTQNVSASKCGGFDKTYPVGWTVAHRIDKHGLEVIRSTRTVTRAEYAARPGFALCDVPPILPGFLRSFDVQEDVYAQRWDVSVTEREIPRGETKLL